MSASSLPLVLVAGTITAVEERRSFQGARWLGITVATDQGPRALDVLPAQYAEFGQLLTVGADVAIEARVSEHARWSTAIAWRMP